MAIDALNDFENIPFCSASALPLSKFVAMHRNGIGNSLKSTGSEYPTDNELKRLIRLSPETIPVGKEFLKDLA
jgi:hypothetical protein